MANKYRKSGRSYEELLEIRHFISTLSEKAKEELEGYPQLTLMCDEDHLLEERKKIIERFDLNEDHTELYIDWLLYEVFELGFKGSRLSGDRAVLFYHERDVERGNPGFDYREENQFIPSETCVVGLITNECCLIDREITASLNDSQIEDLKAVTQEALLRRHVLRIKAEEVISSSGFKIVANGFSCSIPC